MKHSASEKFNSLTNNINSLNKRGYESPLLKVLRYPQIICEFSDGNIFVNDGEEHEIKLLEKANKFFRENSNNYNTIQEEDIIVLPFKTESKISKIERRIYFEELAEEGVEQLFVVRLSGISGQIDRLFRTIIEKKLKVKRHREENPIEIIDPLKCNYGNGYSEFELDIGNNVYMFVFRLKNSKACVSDPFTNRSSKHYSQRNNEKEKSVIQRYEDKNRKGMLYYNLDTIIGENGFEQNPKFKLNIYEIGNYKESEYLKNKMKDFDFIIELFNYMLKCKEEADQNSRSSDNYLPSPESSSLSDFSCSSNESNEYPLSPQSDVSMNDYSNEGCDRMDIDSRKYSQEDKMRLNNALNEFCEEAIKISCVYGFGLNQCNNIKL